MNKNKLYYIKTRMLNEHKVIADSIEEAIRMVKSIEKNDDFEIIEIKLLEENIYIGV